MKTFWRWVEAIVVTSAVFFTGYFTGQQSLRERVAKQFESLGYHVDKSRFADYRVWLPEAPE